jgi:hypothetical protein
VGIQTQGLVMSGLSVIADAPPNSLQPPLPDGIHLRWAFARAAGFPWAGYYLFRRPHFAADRQSIKVALQNLPLGSVGSSTLTTATATVSSDTVLAATDDLPPPGLPELDLSGRSWLRVSPVDLAAEVEIEVGLVQAGEITATGWLQQVPVARAVLRGKAGDVVRATLAFDAISRIELSGGPARLTDLSFVAVQDGVLSGWQALPGFPYPLALPVVHPDYPAWTGSVNQVAAEAAALGRIRYGPPSDWAGARFGAIHDQLLALVQGGPAGPPMAERTTPVPGPAGPPAESMPEQHPLDLLLLGALNPAVAQLAGLYWVDRPPAPDLAYDYMVVADHKGILGGTPLTALDYLRQHGFGDVDAFIVFDKRLDDPAPPLEVPGDVRAYALPGAWTPAGGPQDAGTGTGLRWDRGAVPGGGVLPGKPVLYHLWRADLGVAEPAAPADPASYELVTKDGPVLVVAGPPAGGVAPSRPPDWPPFPLYAVDHGLAEGWYAYQISGIDIFGRHSAASAPGRWYQWEPRPSPRPWYYKEPPGDTVVHPFAVALLDKVGPPAPAAIEAFPLDPGDPTVVADAAYSAWRAANPSLFGLRVRWAWTQAQAEQAPDTREFRIYLHPGRPNAVTGRVTAVTPVTGAADESTVETSIANTLAAGAWTGTRLQVGPDGFQVLGSEAGTPLRLRVRNIGPAREVTPPVRQPCTVAIPEGHPLARDFTLATTWAQRLHVVAFNDHVTTGTDAAGNPVRHYEVFLPGGGTPTVPLTTSLAEPVVYALVSVSAADDKTHTADDPKWAGTPWGGPQRYGNEGPVGQPAIVFRVRREPPPAPKVPPSDAEAILATPADYRSESFFTYRWVPTAGLGTHVFRALDDTLFEVDWQRPSRLTLDPAGNTEHRKLFPDQADEPRWDADKRQQVAAELNALNALKASGATAEAAKAAYQGLSNDAVRVLAGLPGAEAAFAQRTIEPLDPDDPANADRRGPDDPAAYTPVAGLRAWQDTLDGRAANRYLYRAAYVDGAHNRGPLSLAGPPVRLPDVTPPRAPVLTRVLGGERSVALAWASNREPDLAVYQVYRAGDQGAARDTRLMVLAGTLPVAAGDPDLRPAEVAWTDMGRVGGQTTWYRVVAVDRAGNVSAPSEARAATAVDTVPPAAPTWLEATWVVLGAGGVERPWPAAGPGAQERAALKLVFASDVPQARFTVTRQARGERAWRPIAVQGGYEPLAGAAPSFRLYDDAALPERVYAYAVTAISPVGLESTTPRVVQVGRP